MLLPMAADGGVFLARVGHFTIGWRVFAIGMTQGPIAQVSIKQDRPQRADMKIGISAIVCAATLA